MLAGCAKSHSVVVTPAPLPIPSLPAGFTGVVVTATAEPVAATKALGVANLQRMTVTACNYGGAPRIVATPKLLQAMPGLHYSSSAVMTAALNQAHTADWRSITADTATTLGTLSPNVANLFRASQNLQGKLSVLSLAVAGVGLLVKARAPNQPSLVVPDVPMSVSLGPTGSANECAAATIFTAAGDGPDLRGTIQ